MAIASGAAGEFVIRAEPAGAHHGVLGAFLRGRAMRPPLPGEPWLGCVRRYHDDPFGPAVLEARLDAGLVREWVHSWERRIKGGEDPARAAPQHDA
jgi:hypothetical protein